MGAGKSLGPTEIEELYYSFCCSLLILIITSFSHYFSSFYNQINKFPLADTDVLKKYDSYRPQRG